MDILEQEYGNNNNQKTPKKKKVLIALMISIMLFIIILVIQSSMPKNSTPAKESLVFNGETKEIPENFILVDEEGNKFVEIKTLAELSSYQYFNGEYLKATEDKNKCYINNKDDIVGFEYGSDLIYKTQVNSTVEYQNYRLTKPVTSYNNNLYIYIEDVPKSLNIDITYNAEKKQTVINTSEYLIESIQKEYDENKEGIKIDTSSNNKKTLVYDMLVITSNSKYGVIKLSNKDEVLIGNKYSSLSYDEYTGNFIASNSNGKFGVIDEEGSAVIELKYDGIEIINYDPVLYVVKMNNKYGVIDKQGKIAVSIDYDGIGCSSNKDSNANPVTIIKNFQGTKNTVVVKENQKYGLVNISNQDILLDPVLDSVYSKLTDDGELEYFILHNGDEISLNEYIDKDKTRTVITSDDE